VAESTEIRAGVYPGAEAVSLGGGLLMEMGEQRRWLQLRGTLADEKRIAIAGGLRF
jgi:hypothetical protein